MIDLGKRSVLGVFVDVVDYEAAVERIIRAARDGQPFAGSALAVHGVMEAVHDPVLRYRLNHMDLVTPDGQPVRWALNILYGAALKERVYGPTLMLWVLRRAVAEAVPVYLYGSTQDVLEPLIRNLRGQFPGLALAGCEPSKFRPAQNDDIAEIAMRIQASGARIAFVGLGCPRQETFVHELRDRLPLPVLAVGAAFDYHAGRLREPPSAVQRAGLQWLWRLVAEPQRLWHRYLVLSPEYLGRLAFQKAGVSRPDSLGLPPTPSDPVAI